jgi:hypothetical protein
MGTIFAAQLVFQNRMARGFQAEFRFGRKFGDAGVEIARKTAAGEDAVQFGDSFRGELQRTQCGAQAFGQFAENAENFSGFILGKLHELVVRFHGLEGFDENGLSGAAGAVDYARDAAAVLGFERNDEAVVSQRDEIFTGLGLTRTQKLLQHFLDRVARLQDARANSPESAGGVVTDLSIRQNAAANGLLQIA